MKEAFVVVAFAVTSVFGMNSQLKEVNGHHHLNKSVAMTEENIFPEAKNLPKAVREVREKLRDAILKADINAGISQMRKIGKFESLEVLKLLLIYKSKTTLTDNQLGDFIRNLKILESIDEDGNTLLGLAVQRLLFLTQVCCDEEVNLGMFIKHMLKRGANPNVEVAIEKGRRSNFFISEVFPETKVSNISLIGYVMSSYPGNVGDLRFWLLSLLYAYGARLDGSSLWMTWALEFNGVGLDSEDQCKLRTWLAKRGYYFDGFEDSPYGRGRRFIDNMSDDFSRYEIGQ